MNGGRGGTTTFARSTTPAVTTATTVPGMGTTEIKGTVAPGFEAVRDMFEANFESQGDVGASVALTVDGEMVVDLWGGTATYDDGERAVGGGHDRQRVVDHQDDGRPVVV